MLPQPSKLGEVLFEEGIIDHAQLLEALEIQKKDHRRLGEVLIEKGWIDDEKLTEILARILQLPFVRLSEIHIDEDLLVLIPRELMRGHKVFPVALKDNSLTVATHDPLDVAALQEIQYKSGYHVVPVMAGRQDIEEHLDQFSESLNTLQAIQKAGLPGIDDAPIIHLVNSVIAQAIEQKASDIHFEPQRNEMRVRFRIDSVLYAKTPIPKELELKVLSRIKIISGMDVADSRRPQDGRMSLSTGQGEYDIRVSTLPKTLGESIVLRILSKKFLNRSFESLGMAQSEIAVINKLIRQPHGMILVTGPTGSGKTTTLYSMLNILNQVSHNIITVEDPVEYEMEGVNQTTINNRAGYSFATAIRHILRHDPDVIMVGEIRDVETAEIAIRAALTGHLVLSTMHTNTAAGAVTRLLEMKIEPFLISSAVNAVIAQRLVRKLCPFCKKEYTPTDEIISSVGKMISLPDNLTFSKAAGCEQCSQTGFMGRVGVFELLEIKENIRNMVLKSASEEDILRTAITKGMRTLRTSGFEKVFKKITTLEEVLRITSVE